jgi:hypothetical protein
LIATCSNAQSRVCESATLGSYSTLDPGSELASVWAQRLASGESAARGATGSGSSTSVGACATVELVSAENSLPSPARSSGTSFFLIDGFISLIAPIDAEAQLEVGLVGNEGMLGASLILGVGVSPLRALVQGAGRALQLDAAAFRREIERSPTLRRVVSNATYTCS